MLGLEYGAGKIREEGEGGEGEKNNDFQSCVSFLMRQFYRFHACLLLLAFIPIWRGQVRSNKFPYSVAFFFCISIYPYVGDVVRSFSLYNRLIRFYLIIPFVISTMVSTIALYGFFTRVFVCRLLIVYR